MFHLQHLQALYRPVVVRFAGMAHWRLTILHGNFQDFTKFLNFAYTDI